MNHQSEIERLTRRLAEARLRPNPDQGTLNQIGHYVEMIAFHERELKRSFVPYQDHQGRLVMNKLGDFEDDY